MEARAIARAVSTRVKGAPRPLGERFIVATQRREGRVSSRKTRCIECARYDKIIEGRKSGLDLTHYRNNFEILRRDLS